MDAINQPKSLSELAYERIVESLCTGRFAPGERLTQDALARQLKVSRLPVGQALNRLETEGFLCRAGRRGLKVAPLEGEFVRELYEFRAGIDQVSAGLAARRTGSALRERGAALLARGRAAVTARNIGDLIAADMAFHRLICAAAGNRLILETMEPYWNHTRRVMQMILSDDRNQDQIWLEHAAILDAVCAGDAATAEHTARQHVEQAARWLENELAGVRHADRATTANR